MKLHVEWSTTEVRSYSATIEVPDEIAVQGTLAVEDWISDGNNDRLIAAEFDNGEDTCDMASFIRETETWSEA